MHFWRCLSKIIEFFYLQCLLVISGNRLPPQIIISTKQMQAQFQYPSTKTVKLLLSQIENAFMAQQGQKLSKLLKSLYTDPAYNTNADRWKLSIGSSNYQNTMQGQGFYKLLQLIKAFQIQKIKKGINFAFRLHLDVLAHLIKMLDEIKDHESLWLCKPLRQVIRASKKIFFAANRRELETGGALKVKKDDLIRKLQEFIARKTLMEEIKRQIIPLINNMQVSIMLVYHNYGQITTIFKNTKQYGEHGPQFIDNYYFQRGKTHLIYQQFAQAQQYFQKITIKTHGQKRLILKYLIPCKMFLGKTFIPNPENPEQQFPEYQSISKALSKAKFNDYSQSIKKYQKLWIKRGIYLLMDKLRIILWRNLLKKVQKILGEYKLDINKIHKAVLISGGDEKLEECICIISNLIYQGKIKGYIFQNEEQKVLVLKKDGEGFPSLAK